MYNISRIITCASFYGTGSSAVTDMLSEFDGICSLGDYEYRFLQEPDGISDLEYNVVENNHRHNTSDAIKRFIKYMNNLEKMGYGGYDIFGGEFKRLTKQYVDEITELKSHSWWNKDRIDKGVIFCQIDRCYSLLKRIITRNLKTEKRFSLLQGREYGYYTAVTEEEFLDATRRFIRNLFGCVNTENFPFIMVDQMVPATNSARFCRYFDDIRIIAVERDPRDLYLLEKVIWQWGVIPVETVEEFVSWYKITRKYANQKFDKPDTILRIRFEDLIYDYDNAKDKLISFIGISKDAHARPRTKFNPDISIRNTNVMRQISGYESDISYIEKHLSDYLYNFNS